MNACLTCLAVGVPLSEILSGVENLSAPAGRFNAVDLKGGKTAVIDFAHTPDGLEKILSSVKDIAKGKVISVFGCGGERDMLKRPIMGRVSEKLADFTIITSDNPRFEKPEEILADIEKGFLGDNYLKIMDRKVAIKTALEMLEDGDVAVICGKGGELYQDINGIKIPYNDFVQVEKFIKSKHAPT